MARNWIKIETKTVDKPEVCVVATQLRLDPDAVMGKLVRLWSWAEVNRIDGKGMNVTREFIDKLTGKKGFAAALEKAGWLVQAGDLLAFPNFSRHNGPAGKGRALTAERVSRHREKKRSESENETLTSRKVTQSSRELETKKTGVVEHEKSVKAEVKKSESIEKVQTFTNDDLVDAKKLRGSCEGVPQGDSLGSQESVEEVTRTVFQNQDILDSTAMDDPSGVGRDVTTASDQSDRARNDRVPNEDVTGALVGEEVEGIEWGAREVDLEDVETVRWEEASSSLRGSKRPPLETDWPNLSDKGSPSEIAPVSAEPLSGEDSPEETMKSWRAGDLSVQDEAVDENARKESASHEEGGGKAKRSRAISLAPKKVVIPDSPDQPLLF